jgi:hypothetical protein
MLNVQVLKEGRLKNIITHLKKHGAPPDAAEAAEEAAAAAARLQLSEAAKPFKLLPVDKDAGLDVAVHAEVKGGRRARGKGGHVDTLAHNQSGNSGTGHCNTCRGQIAIHAEVKGGPCVYLLWGGFTEVEGGRHVSLSALFDTQCPSDFPEVQSYLLMSLPLQTGPPLPLCPPHLTWVFDGSLSPYPPPHTHTHTALCRGSAVHVFVVQKLGF